jgi:hypothetical protein
VAQEAERKGICPVTEERSLLNRSEEVWWKHLKPSPLAKNSCPEPCLWNAPCATHSNEIHRRIPGVNPPTVAFWFGQHARTRRRCASPPLDSKKGAQTPSRSTDQYRGFAVPCV